MEKAEAVLGGPLAMGGPGYGALKRGGGGGGGNENIKKKGGGDGVALPLAYSHVSVPWS